MISLANLPRELLNDVLQWLPLDALLACRLVSHKFWLLATALAFSKVRVLLNNEQLLAAYEFYSGEKGDICFPVQDLIIGHGQKPMFVIWDRLVALLSRAKHLKKLQIAVPDRNLANEAMRAGYGAIFSMPTLLHVIFTGFLTPPIVVPHHQSMLTRLDAATGFGAVFDADLDYIRQLLPTLPNLRRLCITLPTATVDGQLLSDFLNSLTTNEHPHLKMEHMTSSLTLHISDAAAVVSP
ncbi:hypothetical protein BC940DRAFT_354234 [Gongronella butleri]|nr:hypothetical protein BC940DRAFT_354234 [Gongronella butleri]